MEVSANGRLQKLIISSWTFKHCNGNRIPSGKRGCLAVMDQGLLKMQRKIRPQQQQDKWCRPALGDLPALHLGSNGCVHRDSAYDHLLNSSEFQ